MQARGFWAYRSTISTVSATTIRVRNVTGYMQRPFVRGKRLRPVYYATCGPIWRPNMRRTPRKDKPSTFPPTRHRGPFRHDARLRLRSDDETYFSFAACGRLVLERRHA